MKLDARSERLESESGAISIGRDWLAVLRKGNQRLILGWRGIFYVRRGWERFLFLVGMRKRSGPP